jgi:hypothetical protein
MSGGAWPFLVGGVICLVDSDNERDHERVVEGWMRSEYGGRVE